MCRRDNSGQGRTPVTAGVTKAMLLPQRKQGGMDSDPAVESFLVLSAARLAPRTVEAYRRDLAQLGAYLAKPVGDATTEELERYTARLRADGLSPATIARRTGPPRLGDAACAPPLVCDAPFGARRRSARHPGAARPRLAFDHPDLHRC